MVLRKNIMRSNLIKTLLLFFVTITLSCCSYQDTATPDLNIINVDMKQESKDILNYVFKKIYKLTNTLCEVPFVKIVRMVSRCCFLLPAPASVVTPKFEHKKPFAKLCNFTRHVFYLNGNDRKISIQTVR